MTKEELEKFSRNSEETFEDYKKRLYKIKFETNRPTWDNIAELLNEHQPPWGQHSRKYYTNEAKRMFEDDSLSSADISEYITELKKERYKLTEERVQNNAYIRKLAREDTLKEIAKDYANQMSSKKILDLPDFEMQDMGNKDGILCISDFHYGIEVDNAYNSYNPDVCKKRISTLLTKVIPLIEEHGISCVYVVNLGDMICGRIHQSLRYQSRIDVITQVMDISEILAEFLTQLSHHVLVKYIDVDDNHSRLEPKKTDSLMLETLTRLIPWYLLLRLKDNVNIQVVNNPNRECALLNLQGHSIAAVHGHNDSPNKVIENVKNLTGESINLVLMAHFHHFEANESNDCVRVANGSLMGPDDYALRLRKLSPPSQNFIVVTKETPVYAIYRILL